jgi:hypothetical protein
MPTVIGDNTIQAQSPFMSAKKKVIEGALQDEIKK